MTIDPNDEYLILSDDKIFYTIEGEGEQIGKPSIFMRLAMCNLTCSAWASKGSPSGCDSYISWSVKNKMSFKEIWDEFFSKSGKNYIDALSDGVILKITGGEPLIQQKQLIKFVQYLESMQQMHSYETRIRIDFETNATIMPSEYWRYKATFTTSPKLSTNGDSVTKTYKPDVIKWHVDNHSGFKFVITDASDITEIWCKYVDKFNIPKNKIWFMPCCGSRDEHIANSPDVAKYAKTMRVNFSPRLQLVIWDRALKV